MEVLMDGERIRRIILPAGFIPAVDGAAGCPEPFRRWYAAWFTGNPEDAGRPAVDTVSFSPFRRTVMEALLRVPRGTVVSYSGLARLAGRPGAVRAAASVMARNPFPLLFPCHRVVRNDRRPGAYSGRDDDPLKLRLLAVEGVVPDNSGRIPIGCFLGENL